MARTSRTDVKKIYETQLSDTQLDEFINDANALVTQLLDGKGLSDSLLERIEKYLSAYMASSREHSAASQSVGEVDVDFIEQDVNRYLARAMRLDTTDTLKQEFTDSLTSAGLNYAQKRTS